jgi:hypothetical protein
LSTKKIIFVGFYLNNLEATSALLLSSSLKKYLYDSISLV